MLTQHQIDHKPVRSFDEDRRLFMTQFQDRNRYRPSKSVRWGNRLIGLLGLLLLLLCLWAIIR